MTDEDPPLRFSITPLVVTIGDPVTVCFTHPGLAGQTITIDINDGTPSGATDTLQITLDTSGKGCATWTAPDWLTKTAIFTHLTSQDEAVELENP